MSDADKDARKTQGQMAFYAGIRGGHWLYRDEITEWDNERYRDMTDALRYQVQSQRQAAIQSMPISQSQYQMLVDYGNSIRNPKKKKKAKAGREPQKAFPWRKSRW